jgi:hypothetical protein
LVQIVQVRVLATELRLLVFPGTPGDTGMGFLPSVQVK